MNKVIEIGRLGRDPELTYGGAHKDTAICKFTLAVDRPTEGTDWIRIIAFGKQAENCNKYLKKGSMVAVDGRIQTGSYDGKDGKKVYTTDVVANRIEFLTKPKSDDRHEANQSSSVMDAFIEDDSDLPF
jgi:single-strand DNA-binding protein